MADTLYAVMAGRSSSLRGCYPTPSAAKEHMDFGLKRSRVVKHSFRPMRASRRFLVAEIEWSLADRQPDFLLDVQAESEVAGEQVGSALVRMTRTGAMAYAADMNRQSIGLIRDGIESVPWSVILELGQNVGGINSFQLVNGDLGVCDSTYQRIFRVVRPAVDLATGRLC